MIRATKAVGGVGGLLYGPFARRIVAWGLMAVMTAMSSGAAAEFIRLSPTYGYGPTSPINGTYPTFPSGPEAIAAIKADYQAKVDEGNGRFRVEWGDTITSPTAPCLWSPATINGKPEAFCIRFTLFEKLYAEAPWSQINTGHFSATIQLACPSSFTRAGRALTTDQWGYAIDAEEWCEGFVSPGSLVPLDPPPSCRREDGAATTHPILPATGDKYFAQTDHSESGAHPLEFTRYYLSSRANDSETSSAMGRGWNHNHLVSFAITPMSTTAPEMASVAWGDGSVRRFLRDGSSGNWTPIASADKLTVHAAGATYVRADDDSRYNFDTAGLLQSVTQRNGWVATYRYNSAGLPDLVTNQFGSIARVRVRRCEPAQAGQRVRRPAGLVRVRQRPTPRRRDARGRFDAQLPLRESRLRQRTDRNESERHPIRQLCIRRTGQGDPLRIRGRRGTLSGQLWRGVQRRRDRSARHGAHVLVRQGAGKLAVTVHRCRPAPAASMLPAACRTPMA